MVTDYWRSTHSKHTFSGYPNVLRVATAGHTFWKFIKTEFALHAVRVFTAAACSAPRPVDLTGMERNSTKNAMILRIMTEDLSVGLNSCLPLKRRQPFDHKQYLHTEVRRPRGRQHAGVSHTRCFQPSTRVYYE